LLDDNNIEYEKANEVGTIIYVVLNNKYLGYILISDEIKEESSYVIESLNTFSRTIMLTGDNNTQAEHVKEILNLSDYKANLLPQDKVVELNNIMENNTSLTCFIGDGINDAPVLASANIGIAMGALGSDAAIEASDIVLMKDDLKGLITLKKIAKKTMRVVLENIIFALTIKIGVLILSALGITNMWIAVFADVGVAILAILNAMRVGSKKYD
nr:HAD-IC family P-type ATPase [bacterium]